jgi:hypothetical protein
VTHTPAYKEASVSTRVLAEATVENPLPRTNFRFGHPTPQRGVEVERKWNRSERDKAICRLRRKIMSQPISFKTRRRDFREELRVRLEHVPADHAEGILASYEVLQGLHDRGVLELLRGVLGGGDSVLEIVVEAAKTPEAIHGIRNLIIMLKLAGSIDPDQLHAALDLGHKEAPSSERHSTRIRGKRIVE